MIDFHCHIDLYSDPANIVAHCKERCLYVLSVTTVPSAFEGTAALASAKGRIRTALGLHPELAAARIRELPTFERLLSRTKYVGEVGLDGSQPHRATLETQKGVFNDVLGMCALAGGRILSLHSRGAARLVLDALSSRPDAGRFVLHWFSGSAREVHRAAELGCWFSVNPTMFLTSKGLSTVASMPKRRIVPESDGPFAVVNGVPACPWDAWSIVKDLTKIWNVPESEAADQLTKNFKTLVSPIEGNAEAPGLNIEH